MINATGVSSIFGERLHNACELAPDLAVSGIQIHAEVAPLLQELANQAQDAGFQLKIISGFRSFERQLFIWNAKVMGKRPVLDVNEQPIDLNSLSDSEKVFAVLNWSALPGASRHHWGTDIDVYDASAVPADYAVQLTAQEASTLFKPFHDWLTLELSKKNSVFYRPYYQSSGSVAEELWHLSCEPFAAPMAAALTEDVLRKKIEATDIQLQSAILDNLSTIYARYIAPYQTRR